MGYVTTTIAIVALANLYMYSTGNLSDTILISSGALLIGILFGRILAKFEYFYSEYDDDVYEDDEEYINEEEDYID